MHSVRSWHAPRDYLCVCSFVSSYWIVVYALMLKFSIMAIIVNLVAELICSPDTFKVRDF